MWRDICIENKDNLLKSLRTFRESIRKVEELIEKADKEGLKAFFEKAREKRRSVK